MTTDTNTASDAGSTANGNGKAKDAPKYRMDPTEIPTSIRTAIAQPRQPDGKGGLGPEADVYPAKDGGNYKGRIVHANDEYIVQAIGKGEKTAVVHARADVEIKGASLLSRDANNDLAGRNVQIHYREADKGAAMYPYNAEKEQQQREGSGGKLYAATMTELYTKMAKEYAEEHIKSPKQREEFLKHFGNVTERVVAEMQKGRPDAEQAKTDQARTEPDKGKAQETPQQAQGKQQQPSQDR